MTIKKRRNPRVCAGPRPARLLPMDELQNRSCEVDGRPALFHRWLEEDRVLLHVDVLAAPKQHAALVNSYAQDGVVLPGCHTEVLRETFALVEYMDGTVAKVDPLLVRFVVREEVKCYE